MTQVEGEQVGSVVLRRRIAEGGMGTVWEAEDVEHHRAIAVKFLADGASQDPAAVERFVLEGETAARVASPYVPKILGQGAWPDGTLYIMMDLIEGADLKTRVTDNGPLALGEVVRLVEHVCHAMDAAHRVGVVHRDIKPENIIVRGAGPELSATLVDFGIAKSEAGGTGRPSITADGLTMGTPSYMSPEQLAGAGVDERSDVWSLAVVTYWALTGTLPFRGDSFATVCRAIERGHFTPASELRPDLPVELDRWFVKALDPDPGRRLQSASLMSGMLKVAAARPHEWTQPLPIVTRRHGPAHHVRGAAMALVSVSRTLRPSRAFRLRGARDMAFVAMAGGAVGLLVILGLGRIGRSAAHEAAPVTISASNPSRPTSGAVPRPEAAPPGPAPSASITPPAPAVVAATPWTPSPSVQAAPTTIHFEAPSRTAPEAAPRTAGRVSDASHLVAAVSSASTHPAPPVPHRGRPQSVETSPIASASASAAAEVASPDAGPAAPDPTAWHAGEQLGEP